MKRLTVRSRALVGTTVLCLGSVLRLSAQTTSDATRPSEPDSPLVLSPFVVEASEDGDSYTAKNTLAGTRVRTELRDVGSAIQAVTAKFLQDTGARSSQDLLVYTTNTEVGGSSGNFVGAGNGASIDTRGQRSSPQTNTRVRGLASADNTRDFFLTDIPWDSYNVGRVDIQRGANSILFGIGSPAGIVNSGINGAAFSNSNKVEFRFDNNGSARTSMDFNKVILKDELALRISLLDDNTKYQQEPAYNHDQRGFAAVRYEPAFLKKNGMVTSFRANYETGKVDANRPRVIPPVDAITPWFTSMNKRTFDDTHINDVTPTAPAGSGALSPFLQDNVTPNPNYSPWLGAYGGQIFDQPTAIFADPNSGNLSGYFAPSLNPNGPITHPANFNGGPWSVYKGIVNYSDYARAVQLPNYLLGAYKTKTLADTGIFDYNNKLIDGPNKQELQDFRALNLAMSQSFFDNQLAFEVVYDHQNYSEENNTLITNPYLTVEVASVLPDGRANPNVGRAMVIGAPNANGGKETRRDTLRAQATGEWDFKKHMSNKTMASILGLHRLTAMGSQQQYDEEGSSWYSYVTDRATFQPWSATTLDSRRIPSVSYLSGDLRGLSAANLANIGNISGVQIPYSDQMYKFNPANKPGVAQGSEQNLGDLVGWQWSPFRVLDGYHGTDRRALTTANSVRKTRDIINSRAIVWQGFFWDGTIVPTVGWRKDVDRNYNGGNATQNDDQSVKDNPVLPKGPDDPRVGSNNVSYNSDKGESKSYSIVLHTPKALRARLPFGSDISLFYNKSDNFQPAGGRRDVFGDSLPSPTGKTKDYGFVISALDERVSLKVNWYKTELTNASLDGGGTGALANVYRVSSNEAWGYMFGKWAQLKIPGTGFDDNYAHTISNDPTSPLIDPTVTDLRYQPAPGQSVADALKVQNAAYAAFFDPANKPPERFLTYWGINRNTWDPTLGWAGGGVNFSVPGSLAVTGDTVSKGVEYEFNAQPLPGWNITINASKTSAQRVNLASSFASWVDSRNTYYNGPAGDIRLWNGSYAGTQTIKTVWSEFYSSYQLYRLQEHGDVPELRPWRFNVITNYDFRQGRLKGVNVGGSYRWQDGIVVGYPIKNSFFDLANPYMGPSETTIDLWIGYERKLSKKVSWRVQLNARNVLGSDDLIPVTVQPDGSPGTSRIAEPRVFTLTNTFKF